MSLQECTVTELREMLITYLSDHMKAMLEHDHVAYEKSATLFKAAAEEMLCRGYEVIS